jgi:hypothetical protein
MSHLESAKVLGDLASDDPQEKIKAKDRNRKRIEASKKRSAKS